MGRSAQEMQGRSSNPVCRRLGARLPGAAAAWMALLWAAQPAPVPAATFVRVADADLAAQAAVVVEGRVLSADPMAGGAQAATEYRIEVDRTISGPSVAPRIDVRVPGGRLPDGSRVHVFGAPRFEAGERVLLFLAPAGAGAPKKLAVLHLMQGAFHVVEVDGRELAVRDFAGATEIHRPGRQPGETARARDLERFRGWLADRARGTSRPPDYFVAAPAAAAQKFGLVRSVTDGIPARWQVFDGGGSVAYRAHQDGQPGVPGGGFEEFQAALRIWDEDPGTPIRTSYAGTTDRTTGGLAADGVNALLFDDPNDHFNTLFSCASGGTLAASWVRYGEPKHTWNGLEWWTIFEGDVVTNQGIACWMEVGRRAEEVFAHEIGHTLGLGHSCGDARNGPCDVEILDQALMRSVPHADGRGASLGQDDRDGLALIYATLDAPPASPGDLRAEIVAGGALGLTWSDGSGNEAGFEVERSLPDGGGVFEALATAGGNTPRYVDREVSSGVAYTYRVRAFNGAGVSGYSNEATAVAGGELAPTDLIATALSTSAIGLAWRDNAADEDGYLIHGSDGGEFIPLGATPRNSEATLVQGLRPATTYSFRVRALGGSGDSSFSNEASATTLPTDPPGDCVAGPRTLCLGRGRFQVEVEWRDFEALRGAGRVVELGAAQPEDSGLFWFFESENWELLVKVLDGCEFNGYFWVFAAATTNVEYALRVTDTRSGVEWSYDNPLGNAAAAVADVEAFATCP